ncbi:hypothetical protein ES703_63441 [subsurface metagenome]
MSRIQDATKVEHALSIRANQFEESVFDDHPIAYTRKRLLDSYKTTNNYEDSETEKTRSNIFDGRLFKEKIIQIVNKHATNGAKFKVLGCLDPKKWEEIQGEAGLNGGTSILLDAGDISELAKPLAFYKVLVASNVSNESCVIDAYMGAKT